MRSVGCANRRGRISASTQFAIVRVVTYAEVLSLPRGTQVRTSDGRIGRISWWQHASESVGVHVDGNGTTTVRATELRRGPDGTLEVSSTVR